MDPGRDIRVFFGAMEQSELQFFDRAIPVVVVEMTVFVHSAVGGQEMFLNADDAGIIRGGNLVDFFAFARHVYLLSFFVVIRLCGLFLQLRLGLT